VQASDSTASEALHAVASSQPEYPTQASDSPLLHCGQATSLRDLLEQTIEIQASDLHIHSGSNLLVRRGGDICNAPGGM